MRPANTHRDSAKCANSCSQIARNSSSGEKQREIQANSFAAALLMPKKLVINEIDSYYRGPHDNKDLVKHLSNRFEVSKNAMTYRLINLDLIDLGYKSTIE